jgi:hypothetical protein
MTYTRFGLTDVPSSICETGMDVQRPRISAMRLWCSGDKCWMTTYAMPLSGVVALKKVFRASTPPAEAPIPTMGKGQRAREVKSTGAVALSEAPA